MMKGVLIFNQLNDVVFMHYDEGFRRHVTARATESGLRENTDIDGPVDPNVAMQLFSPLVASLRFMTEQVDNPYQSIRCENDFLFVMEQYHDQILLAINGDKLETEEFLHRKLLILQRIVRFFFGPCDEEIRRDKLHERGTRWRFVAQLLDAWVELYNSEQSFLMEAVERLHVNQLLNAKCIQLLEMVLSSVRTTGGEKGAVHALLLVNSKLLSLFSMRTAYELLPSDLLLLTVLAKTHFPTHQRLEDFFSHSMAMGPGPPPPAAPTTTATDHYQSAPEYHEDSEELEYFSSVPSTPERSPDRGPSPQNELIAVKEEEVDEEGDLPEAQEAHGSADELQTLLTMYYPPRASVEEARSYDKFTVMLGTPVCKYTPYTAHCVELMPDIILLVLCEVTRTKLSGTICQTVSVLRAVLHKAAVTNLQGKQTLDFIDNNLRKVMDGVRKAKVGSHVGRLLDDLSKKWDLSRRSGLLAYLDSRQNTDLSSRLEATLTSVLDRLKDLFKVLYLTPHRPSPEAALNLTRSIEYCQQLMRRHLYDYKDYLAVKAQRNITMSNFVEDFPGLIHFIYVDRSTHQMVAPSINVTKHCVPGRVDMMKIIKRKLWSKIPDIQTRLKTGHLTQVLRDGDFLYSYFLWFEGGTGHPVPISSSYDGVKENMLPGILAGGFYRQLMRQTFPSVQQHGLRAYELFMLHVGIVPTHLVLRQGRKLAGMMWETTGEANSPITLL